MLLRLTDGTTTLTLSGSGVYLGATYFPSSAAGGADRVTETLTLTLEGAADSVRAAVNDIEQLFEAARIRNLLLTPRVFLEFRPVNTATDIFRSEVFDGRVNWASAPARRYLDSTQSVVEVAVIVERSALWEGPQEELYLSSSTQTERTGGVTIYNNDNAGSPNWVGIASSRVKGTRPAPVKFQLTNNAGTGLFWRNIYIGNNAFSDPTNADVWLLGSEASGGASQSWVANVTHSTNTWLFPLSATLLGQAQGRTFRAIVAFDTAPTTAYVRGAVGSYISLNYSAQRMGPERYAAGELVDLGAFPIPPGGYAAANAGAAFVVSVRSSSAGSGQIDFIQLMPTDSYRRIDQIGYSIANGAGVIDDGIERVSYAFDGGSRYPIVRPGPALKVFPERTQRLYVLVDESGAFNAGRQMTVQAWYRPIYDAV
jgi:hypothetical protein